MQAMQTALDEEMGEEDEDMGEEGEGVDAAQLFQMLRNSPQFAQLRMLARTNPAALEGVLQNLPEEVLHVISSNQEEFLRLLMEDGPTGAGGAGGAAPAQPQAFAY